ncbi:AAA family ATPase [Mollicutes bacterium LVI A0039]|nr:AAA family ATPase [Mollicutes bacterium LVI A0039]
MAKVISVYNNKGGVGKTTTTKRLAHYLTNNDKRVLIVDMDPQGNITSQFTKEVTSPSIYNVLLEKALVEDAVRTTEYKQIDILPSSLKLLNANNEIMLESMRGLNPTTRLKEKIKSTDNYDYILIDCPPTMDLLVTNALMVTDEIIIPLTVDNYSLDGINMLLEKIFEVKENGNDNLEISAIFLNRFKRSNIHNEMKKVLSDSLKDYVVDNVIGDYAVVNENTFTNDENKIEKHKVNAQFNNLFNKIGVL